jgi:hypothetical protein
MNLEKLKQEFQRNKPQNVSNVIPAIEGDN